MPESFFNKVAGLICIFIKKETLARAFSCKFCEIVKNKRFPVNFEKLLRTSFFTETPVFLRTTASHELGVDLSCILFSNNYP